MFTIRKIYAIIFINIYHLKEYQKMEQNPRTILQDAGIDYDAAVARFSGNSGLYSIFAQISTG